MRHLNILAAALLMAALPAVLPAQDESVYKRGATYLESTMPPSPEPASVVKFADVPFSHSCGFAEYDVPFYTIEGRELSIPIGLHYVTGGVRLDEIAGVAGLGWTLEAGGCITRTVMDMPDEFSAIGFTHELPSGDLLEALEDMDATYNGVETYLDKIIEHKVDSRLDQYSYNVCGLQGSFIIQDDGSVFQLNGDGVEIGFTRTSDGAIDVFVLTGPDGTVYTLSEKETATHKGTMATMVTPSTGQADCWSATTAWHITSMRSRSGLETATFSYSEPAEWERNIYAKTSTLTAVATGYSAVGWMGINPSTRNSGTYIYNTYDTKVLTGISLGGTDAEFTYAQGTGKNLHTDSKFPQNNYPFRLTGISVQTAGNPSELCRLDVGTARASQDGRIILNSLDLYRGGVLDDTWKFEYNTIDKTVSHYSQDWFGYYNGQNEYFKLTTITDPYRKSTSTCPYEFNSSSTGFTLVNGHPNPEHSAYMSLKSVNNDGATTRFSYEGNMFYDETVSADVRDTTYIGIRVKKIFSSSAFTDPYVRIFRYEAPVASGPTEPAPELYMTADCSLSMDGIQEIYTWNCTFNASSVHEGPSIHDTRVHYGRVTEDVYSGLFYQLGDKVYEPATGQRRIVYEFDTKDVQTGKSYVDERFPSGCEEHYRSALLEFSPWMAVSKYYSDSGTSRSALLIRKEEYVYGIYSFDYNLILSSDYIYDESDEAQVLVGYKAKLMMKKPASNNLANIYHYPLKITRYTRRNPIKTVNVEHLPSGNDTTVLKTVYVTRKKMSDPVRISSVTTSKDNISHIRKLTYADTWSGDETWPGDLQSQHCLSAPLKIEHRKRVALEAIYQYPLSTAATSLPLYPNDGSYQLKEE